MNPTVHLFDTAARNATSYGSLRWFSRPEALNTTAMIAVEVTFTPGNGHPFHFHPEQDELIYVLEGEVRQWVDQVLHVLQAGDSVFVPHGTVHGSMNASSVDSRILVVRVRPADAKESDAVEVQHEAPWNGLELRWGDPE